MKKNIVSVVGLLLISSLSFGQNSVPPITPKVAIASAVVTPSAEQIIDKYINAIGGKEAIGKIKDYTIIFSGEVQGMVLEITFQKKILNKAFLTVSVVGMGEMQKIICDGTKARIVAQGKVTDVSGNDIKSLVITQAGMFPEMNYIASGVNLIVAGIEKIDGKDVYKINASLDNKQWSDYFDVNTGLKIRQEIVVETPMGTNTVKVSYDDYKDEAGVKIPHTLSQDMGSIQLALTASKIEMNKNLPDSLFEIK